MIANRHAGYPVPPVRRSLSRCLLFLCPLVVLGAGRIAHAQDVNWRNDYARAIKESADTGRPLFVTFGTENCYWCKQLELRTFKDADLVKNINERCVPLKVDAARNAYLVQALRIQSYPTLVFAGPDGTILKIKEGFVESPVLREDMVKVLASVGTPDWMQRDLETAEKSLAEHDHARAIALLRIVVEDGKDRPAQVKARKILQELERQAAAGAVKAKELASEGKTKEAIDEISHLNKIYPGTLAAREGKQWMLRLASRGDNHRERKCQAEDLLKQARDDYSSQQYLSCLDRCEILTSQFADLPEGVAAEKLASELKTNPEWTRQACEQLEERLCVLYRALADSWLKKGQPQQAIYYLDRIVKLFPGTKHSEAAQAQLARLLGAPGPLERKK